MVDSTIQYTNDCTDPPLPTKGNRDFLTEVKLQLMFGLSDLEKTSYFSDKSVHIYNVAHIGQTMLQFQIIVEHLFKD
jgi:hypothetical protein